MSNAEISQFVNAHRSLPIEQKLKHSRIKNKAELGYLLNEIEATLAEERIIGFAQKEALVRVQAECQKIRSWKSENQKGATGNDFREKQEKLKEVWLPLWNRIEEWHRELRGVPRTIGDWDGVEDV